MQIISIYEGIDPQSKMDCMTILRNLSFSQSLLCSILWVFYCHQMKHIILHVLSFYTNLKQYAKKNFVILVVVVVPFLVFYAFLLRYMLFYTCKLTRSNILHWWIVDHVALHTHIHTRTPHPTLRYDTVASRYINVTIWSSLSCER